MYGMEPLRILLRWLYWALLQSTYLKWFLHTRYVLCQFQVLLVLSLALHHHVICKLEHFRQAIPLRDEDLTNDQACPQVAKKIGAHKGTSPTDEIFQFDPVQRDSPKNINFKSKTSRVKPILLKKDYLAPSLRKSRIYLSFTFNPISVLACFCAETTVT